MNANVPSDDINNPNTNIVIADLIVQQYIDNYIPRTDGKIIYSPLCVVRLLATIPKKCNFNGTKINAARVIINLKALNLVPINTTPLYNLRSNVTRGLISNDTTWTSMKTDSSSSYLSPKEFNQFIESLKDQTAGGGALSVSEIKVMLFEFIKDVHQKKNKTIHS